MIRKIMVFVTVLAMNQVHAQKKEQYIVFKGTADAKYNGQFVHIYNNILNEKHDSTLITNGNFEFKRPFTQPTRYSFYSGYEYNTKHGYTPLAVLVDHPVVIQIKADMESLVNSKVSGSAAQELYNRFSGQTGAAQQKVMDGLYAKYGRDFVENQQPDTSSIKYKELIKDYTEANEKNTKLTVPLVEKTIRQNPASLASVFILYTNMTDLDLPKIEELYKVLSPAYKKSSFGVEIENSINGQKRSAIGNQVEDFTLNDQQGKPMKFSMLKGKYVLIDFWGSWCGPCHVAFKYLRVLHEKYHDKGFEILGIATEYGKEDAWLKDIEKEKLPWLQMLDGTKNKNISQKQFAVNKYPTTVLVDPTGKIIGRDLSEAEIDKILSQL